MTPLLCDECNSMHITWCIFYAFLAATSVSHSHQCDAWWVARECLAYDSPLLVILLIIVCPFNTLRWRHNRGDGVSNHPPHHCLLDRLFRNRSKKTSKLRVTGLCAGNSPMTGEVPAQRASNAENVSIWWHHHESYQRAYIDHWSYWLLSVRNYLRQHKWLFSLYTISQHWYGTGSWNLSL